MNSQIPSSHYFGTGPHTASGGAGGAPALMASNDTSLHAIEHTVAIVASYVSHNPVSQERLGELIATVHTAVNGLSSPAPAIVEPALSPAVPIKKSITPDFIICLEDGQKFKSLKRHLSALGMTPEQYRAKWGLPADYPMAAPNYSAVRSQLAKDNGLGKKG